MPKNRPKVTTNKQNVKKAENTFKSKKSSDNKTKKSVAKAQKGGNGTF